MFDHQKTLHFLTFDPQNHRIFPTKRPTNDGDPDSMVWSPTLRMRFRPGLVMGDPQVTMGWNTLKSWLNDLDDCTLMTWMISPFGTWRSNFSKTSRTLETWNLWDSDLRIGGSNQQSGGKEPVAMGFRGYGTANLIWSVNTGMPSKRPFRFTIGW